MSDEPGDEHTLNGRLLDALVYAPIGLVLAAVEEFPKLADRGREKLGTQVSSARAVGEFVVVAGGKELQRRSGSVFRRPDRQSPESKPGVSAPPLRSVTNPGPGVVPTPSTGNGSVADHPSAPTVSAHVPAAADLAIPAYDTLSASQVVQRLDGLSRGQLVSARAYEAGTRGRRTILSRVDQLLDERA